MADTKSKVRIENIRSRFDADLARLQETVDRHCPVLDDLRRPVPVNLELRNGSWLARWSPLSIHLCVCPKDATASQADGERSADPESGICTVMPQSTPARSCPLD